MEVSLFPDEHYCLRFAPPRRRELPQLSAYHEAVRVALQIQVGSVNALPHCLPLFALVASPLVCKFVPFVSTLHTRLSSARRSLAGQ